MHNSKIMTLREFKQRFEAGHFAATDFDTQVEAGWYDWFCSTEALAGRLKRLYPIIRMIDNDFLLDNYYLWFKNNCPCAGSLYDDIRFEPLNKYLKIAEEDSLRDKFFFGIAVDDKRHEFKYSLFSGRNDYYTEFETNNRKELVAYINKMGMEFEQIYQAEAIEQ